jgi:hypothetical protein
MKHEWTTIMLEWTTMLWSGVSDALVGQHEWNGQSLSLPNIGYIFYITSTPDGWRGLGAHPQYMVLFDLWVISD